MQPKVNPCGKSDVSKGEILHAEVVPEDAVPIAAADVRRFALALDRLPRWRVVGRIRSCRGQFAVASGLDRFVSPGDVCRLGPLGGSDTPLLAEVVGFDDAGTRLVAYDELAGVVRGTPVTLDRDWSEVAPDRSWLGRVIDALARPVDGGAPLREGPVARPVLARPPDAARRRPLGRRLRLGVRALDLFVPCVEGQRLGLFAGSGVGKSTLVSMIARQAEADVIVVGLVGERGREVGEFLRHALGPDGLRRSVVVVATSDQPAMLRRRAGNLTLAVAEHFRDLGARVLCLFDSVTRYATALREIHLAAGEMPATRGYPPSVFTELPKLLERAGPGPGEGTITALFSVLVEGDDHNEPVADTVRGILDGHVVLDRRIAERGRFPAIDILASVSRTAPGCYTPEERGLVAEARRLLSTFADMADLIRAGVYRPGSDPEVDRAVALQPRIEALLGQAPEDGADPDPFARLRAILQGEAGAPGDPA